VKFVRGRADARWFPSRHNAALFRLIAYLRLRRAQPEQRDVVMVIDRHQSAIETWLVMSWLIVTLACYLTATIFVDWPIALALPVSLAIAFPLLEVPAITSAMTVAPIWNAITRRSDGIRINTVVVLLLFVAASAYFATRDTWVRFVAWQFLALLALNAVAAIAIVPLRGSIARLEASFGGVTFEA
jgi:hypothetical protein